MKRISKMLVAAIIVMATTMGVSAQNYMNPNDNYKHQVPASKKHKFKDSFKNDQMIDLTSDNYKQPKYKKAKKSAFHDNFTNVQKSSTANSKHPYGL